MAPAVVRDFQALQTSHRRLYVRFELEDVCAPIRGALFLGHEDAGASPTRWEALCQLTRVGEGFNFEQVALTDDLSVRFVQVRLRMGGMAMWLPRAARVVRVG